MTDNFNIEIGGEKLEAKECRYPAGVLDHLRDLMQTTPRNDPLWGYLDTAHDAVSELLGMLLP
jgi:hypothetical protein